MDGTIVIGSYAGWSVMLDPGGSYLVFDPKQTFAKFSGSDITKDVYAHWTYLGPESNVTIDPNGGSLRVRGYDVSSSKTFNNYDLQTASLYIPNPTKTSSSVPDKCSVTFDYNGGNGSSIIIILVQPLI